MIKCALFEFTRENGRGCISDELRKNTGARAAFDTRARDLRNHGVGSVETRNFCPHIEQGIYKLKIRFKPQLRPHLCKGPGDKEGEATFLVWATEENSQLDPPDVIDVAVARRATVIDSPERKKAI